MIWICTSIACPEQYDIYRETGPAIAYFRLRYGNLYVHPYNQDHNIDWDIIIYEKHYDDERGCFESEEEREQMLNRIDTKIKWYLVKQWFINLFK